jgi:hypothetical protein
MLVSAVASHKLGVGARETSGTTSNIARAPALGSSKRLSICIAINRHVGRFRCRPEGVAAEEKYS